MRFTMTRKRMVLVACAVLAATAMAAVTIVNSGAFASGHPLGPVAPPAATVLARQESLDAAADAITAVLKADPNYTGLSVDAPRNRLIAYGTAQFDPSLWTTALGAMPNGATLNYARSILTDRHVAELTAYVTQRANHGLRAKSWGLQRLDGPFDIGLTKGAALSADDQKYFATYGPGAVVTHVDDGRPV